MAACFTKVEAANKVEDPLGPFPIFRKYDRNGLNVQFETKRASNLDEATIQWAFDLVKANMKTLYENSEWGWKDKEKFEEMTQYNAWYLIARDQDDNPVAFCHFRFDVEVDMEVLYCYEIQLIPEVRKKGLGKFMMQILELMANKYEMKNVMLTVFKHNSVANEFFKKKLNYLVDDISPEQDIYDEQEISYEILSKYTKIGREWLVCARDHSCTKGCC